MRNLLFAALAFFGFSVFAAEALPLPKVGECWTYATRPGEENSFLVVRRIETLPVLGEVAHISIFKLKMLSPAALGQHVEFVGHMPIALASVRASVREKVTRHFPVVDWEGGYRMWREATTKSGQTGIFIEPVSACVAILEKTLFGGNKAR